MQKDTKLFRLPQVLEITGLGRSTIYVKIKAGEFPAPINLGPRSVAWRSTDVTGWIDSRIRYPQI